jgi:hypothetical protein
MPNSRDMVDLVGVKDGIQTVLGKVSMPPRMKLRELAVSYYGGDVDDDMSDAAMAFSMGEVFLDWLIAQGWKIPLSVERIEDAK